MNRRLILTLLALLLGIGALISAGKLFPHRGAPASAELATPMLAVATLQPIHGKALFFTSPATDFLKAHWQEWALKTAANGDSASPEKLAHDFDAAAQDPKAWRALDRKWRFDALLLTGDPSGFLPLLEHLLQSPDWVLITLDHTSLVFERAPAHAWSHAELEPLARQFASHSADEQSEIRVQIAHRLTAIGEAEFAKTFLAEALKANPDSSPLLTELASTYGALSQWQKALEVADKAVAADSAYQAAIVMKANALYACGKFDDALTITRRLVADAPQNGQNLALHARVAHAAHAYKEEAEALEKIVSLSKAQAAPLADWIVHLGQAYAAEGEPEKALEQFQLALKEPGLTEHERAFAEKGVERLKSSAQIF